MPRFHKRRRRTRGGRKFRKRFRRSFRKHFLRRRGKRRSNRIVRKRLGGILYKTADAFKCKMKAITYWSGSGFDGTSIIWTGQAYGANQMHDPMFSAGTVQPYGYDHMCTLFDQYKVRASKIETKISVFDTSGTASATAPCEMQMILFPYLDHPSRNDFQDYANNWNQLQNLPARFAKVKYFIPDCPNMPGGRKPRVWKWKHYFNFNKFVGYKIPDSQLVRDIDSSTGPNLLFNWGFMVGSNNPTTVATYPPTTMIVKGYFIITYYVEWSRPRTILKSTTGQTTIPVPGTGATATHDETLTG